MRKYQHENKEAIALLQKKYYQNNKEAFRIYFKQWKIDNREQISNIHRIDS
jgi:post-segregation antitoxin (ccd killing protein)